MNERGVELDHSALVWIENSLARGLAISTAFLERGVLSTMRCIACLPRDTPTDSLYDFDDGDREMRRTKGVEILKAFLEHRYEKAAVFVVEDELASPDDEWIREQGLDFAHFARGDELYHWLPLWPPIDADRMDDFLGESSSGYPTNGFVLRMTVADFDGIKESPPAIADAVDAVVVSAYDDMAYIAAFPSP